MLMRDRAAAAVLLLFGLAGAVEARKLAVGDLSRPGPGFFPFYLALALSLVSLALLMRSLRARAPMAEPAPAEPVRRVKAAWTLLAGVAYAFALDPLGFLVATFLFLLFLFSAIAPQRWMVAVATSLTTSLVTYLVFKVWLGAQLPSGVLGF